MVWANRGRDLLESSAANTPKISMGKPAARRVTDVLRGDWRTERPWGTESAFFDFCVLSVYI